MKWLTSAPTISLSPTISLTVSRKGNGTNRPTSAGDFVVIEEAISLARSMASCLVWGFTVKKAVVRERSSQSSKCCNVRATAHWNETNRRMMNQYMFTLILTLPVTSAVEKRWEGMKTSVNLRRKRDPMHCVHNICNLHERLSSKQLASRSGRTWCLRDKGQYRRSSDTSRDQEGCSKR